MQTPTDEKVHSMLDQVAIWELPGEQKTEVAQAIIDDLNTGVEYWSQMVLSAIIATLGLFINATPVVIGAMLIAPILRPIQAVSFATTTGNRRLFFRGLRLLFLSIAVGVFAAVLMTRLLPFTQLTNEILMRTQPTIIDLGIAFASGLIAFLAFGFKKIAAGLAGVAMAASLVPPLGVIGIGLGLMNWEVASGSTILFLTNLVAIIIGGVIIFFLFGYAPNQRKERNTSIISTITAALFMIILAIPLVGSFTRIITAEQEKNTIQAVTNGYLMSNFSDVSLESFEHNTTAMQTESVTQGTPVSLSIKAPSSTDITQEHKDELTQTIAQALNKDIELTMTIIPFTSVKVAGTQSRSPLEKATQQIQTFLDILYPPVILLDTQLRQQSQAVLIAEFFTSEQFDRTRFKEQLEEHLGEKGVSYDVLLITWKDNQEKETDSDLTDEQREWQKSIQTLSSNFRSTFPNDLLQKLTLKNAVSTGYVIDLFIITSSDQDSITQALQSWQETAEAILDHPITIKSHIQYSETITVQ